MSKEVNVWNRFIAKIKKVSLSIRIVRLVRFGWIEWICSSKYLIVIEIPN